MRELDDAFGLSALLDVLLGGAALVSEPHHPFWLHGQVGDGDAQPGEKLARMPFDLGDDAALIRPALRLIVEIPVEALDLDQ